jgi:hypothetical protein
LEGFHHQAVILLIVLPLMHGPVRIFRDSHQLGRTVDLFMTYPLFHHRALMGRGSS